MNSFFTVLLSIATIFSPLFSQTQIGLDIDGEGPEDGFGSSVSLSSDGSRVAIGAPGNDGNGEAAGHVRVYEWTGGNWIQLGADIDGEAQANASGTSVSLSSDGTRVAIGATNNDDNGGNAGQVRVYGWTGSNWEQMGGDIDGEGSGDLSGHSVSLSANGSRVAIGAPGNDGNADDTGQVRVYGWNGSIWEQIGEDIDGEAADEGLGWSVSLSSDGNRVAIGVGGDLFFFSNNFTGYVRIYDWTGDSWEQVGADIVGDKAGNFSGYSVSLSSNGNRVAFGAPYHNSNTGHVKVYDWTGGSWEQMGEDINGEAAGDNSGWSVSLSSTGDRVAIGARWNSGNGEDAGQVRVYDWIGGSWEQMGNDIDGEAADNWSGWSTSLSSDGNRIAIGAPLNNGIGHVRVYEPTPLSTVVPNLNTTIVIYPNPTSGKIELPGVEYRAVNIIDNSGRIVWKTKKQESEINIQDLAPGIYSIQIIMDDQMVTKKIIKE